MFPGTLPPCDFAGNEVYHTQAGSEQLPWNGILRRLESTEGAGSKRKDGDREKEGKGGRK